MQDWSNYFDWAMKASMGAVGAYGVHILGQMKRSIDELNQSMAKIIERTEWHTKEIERLDERVQRVEVKVKR
jgi:hypothetical protein